MRLKHGWGLGWWLVATVGGVAACGGSAFDEGVPGAGGAAGAGTGTSGSGGASAGKGGATSAGSGGASAGSGGASAGSGGATFAGSGGASAGSGGASAGSGGASAGSGGASAGSGGGGAAGASGAGAGGAGAGGAVGGCSPDFSACTTSNGANGLCASGACGPCTSPADDLACNAAYGAKNGNSVCVQGACAPCDHVGSAYVVDPVAGNDAIATGSGTSGGAAVGACAFKTVTAAIKAIGGNPNKSTLTIEIVGPSTVAAGETFPFVIPINTTLTTRVGSVTIAPTGANIRAITLNEVGSGINGPLGLTIDGQGATGSSRGVVFDTGADDTTTLKHVRIRRFPSTGISVSSTARIGYPPTRGMVLQGVLVDECGGNASGAAVGVGDTAVFLTISVSPGQAQTKITNSPGTGLRVVGAAGVKIVGGVDFAAPAGLIEVTGNAAAGIDVQQGATGPISPITGVLVRKNGKGAVAGPGIRASMTSKLVLRSSLSLENGTHGVHVVAPDNLLSGALVGVDLGVDGNFGKNVLQADSGGSLRNPGSGVCFTAPSAGAYVIPARGNTFGAAKTCATTAAVLEYAAGCLDADVGVTNGLASSIDTLLCTQN